MHFAEQKYKLELIKTKRNQKWKIPHVLERWNLCSSSYKNRKLKVKLRRWSSRKKKECIFCTVYSVQREFYNICVSPLGVVYWIHFQNLHTFTYQKTLFDTLSLIVFKIVLTYSLTKLFPLSWLCWRKTLFLNLFC